jgi:transcriptional regulator with PAS, ATPase and Fis domain
VNVLQVRAPALRERRQDILPLAQHFIRRYNEKNTCAISDHISSEVLQILEAYSWPGNVRELENITKRLALMVGNQGTLTEAAVLSVPELKQTTRSPFHCAERTKDHQLPAFDGPNARAKDACQCPCSEELNLYRRCMNQAGGNVAEVARQLNIPRNTLSRRMKKLESRCAS